MVVRLFYTEDGGGSIPSRGTKGHQEKCTAPISGHTLGVTPPVRASATGVTHC